MYVCMYACRFISICTYVYKCMSVYMCVYIPCVCTYRHINVRCRASRALYLLYRVSGASDSVYKEYEDSSRLQRSYGPFFWKNSNGNMFYPHMPSKRRSPPCPKNVQLTLTSARNIQLKPYKTSIGPWVLRFTTT